MTNKINFSKITVEKEIPNETLELIKQIVPDVIEDGKINCKKLNNTVGEMMVDPDEPEHFGLNWPGKRMSIKKARTPSKQTLIPIPGDGVDEEKTKNIFIEGENMEVLKLLQKSYSGRIKMIYIDPPYNTGSDLIYKDKFTESEKSFLESTGQIDDDGNDMIANKKSSGRFHTNWLNLIYPRLKLAKELLADDGVIFVSIDDNEIHNLRIILNEIFGEENFISEIVVQSNPGGRDYGGVAKTHEYLVVYSNSSETSISGIAIDVESLPEKDDLGWYEPRELRNRNVRFNQQNRKNLFYSFFVNPQLQANGKYNDVSLKPIKDYVEVFPAISQGIQTVWRWGREKSELGISENNVVAKKKKDGNYLIIEKFRKESKMIKSILLGSKYTTEHGSEIVKELFDGKKVFDYPKPTDLLSEIIEIGTSDGDIIMDFFAGSSSIAHATMLVNSDKNIHRNYICVQIPDLLDKNNNNQREAVEFCESFKKPTNLAEISKERIRRAGKKINKETSADIDYGFKVFKLQKESNIKDDSEMFGLTDQLTLDSAAENLSSLRPGWTKENLLTEILLTQGFPLTSKVEKDLSITTNEIMIITSSFDDRPDKLVICLDPILNRQTINNLPVGELDNFIFLESALPKTGGDEIKQILHERFKTRIKVI